MRFTIYDSAGTVVNVIDADKEFCEEYCNQNNYSFEEIRDPEEVKAPFIDPISDARLGAIIQQLISTDETAIELYEAMMAQEEINTAQDDALIELYEMIGG